MRPFGRSLRLLATALADAALVLCLAGTVAVTAAANEPGREEERRAMVREQIASRGIDDESTLEAMRAVPRHRFVPAGQARYAYEDRPLPIGHGQTISQPYIVAYMTELARPSPAKKILEVGTGSGYQAAVLAEAGAEVYSIEIIPELARSASERLQRLGYDRVRTRQGDGFHGWAQHAPFDAIVVTAAAEFIPPPLLDQLADGGRMIIPVGSPFLVQTLMLVERKGDDLVTRNLLPVRFVPLRRGG
ncbi:MAG: protein-L-isoaspartate(D-aspartate) O-methyltransferase [Desulfuromonadales bacterium]|nr:protein-L-isoaspartate(D-aspartate) O-methyltransferase [Desulfuromonadales bacterium]NIR33667.1 protein-L-isoaspartate(D-aspartate) O-methyltransferase [Desulfuromonadales bacterium]NIS42358.1 protein-L-isoaspartate(D-aspartate) O-methyltransferase [Desulfuromonadales bacterium]